MVTTRLSSKGQIIIPKGVRVAHKWPPGTAFAVEDRPEGVLLRPLKPFENTTLKEVIGCTGYEGPTQSLEDMQEAINQEARRHKP
jgi:AbrB family looped-hinge helix DNA binding protein